MKKLIIAEKPSLARNIILAIGTNTFERKNGYFESNDYIVSWALGHLLGLKDIEEYASDYNPEEKHSWTLEGLPYFPHPFQFKLKKDPKPDKTKAIKEQYSCLKKLVARPDVDCIIHAGDADREGEVIIRNILISFRNTKPVKRLWMPEQTEQTIRNGLKFLEDDKKYDNLYNEGLARTFIDWLYGINLSRLTSLKAGTLLRVGRVIVVIVKAIFDRDKEIENFVPEPYFCICSKEKTKDVLIELTSKKKFDKEHPTDAGKMCEIYNRETARVSEVKKERKNISPGKLYSLSKLQGVLGKKYKMTPQDSMIIIQKLYEDGYITYPRTNSEYLAAAESTKINQVILLLQKQGFKVEPKDNKKTIYDDSKIESHSALTPTYKFPDLTKLSESERLVYETIRNRFLAVFCSVPCVVDRTTITIQLGDLETFHIRGDVYVQKGWKYYENIKTEDKELPPLLEGDVVNINFKPVEKETTPPKHYTVETLNNYLMNPFKKQKEQNADDNHDLETTEEDAVKKLAEEDEDYKAIFEGLEIGTEATRTGIIGNAILSKYISLKNNAYYIEPKGIYLIESLEKLGINMDKYKTAELGKALKQVYRQEITVDAGIKLAEKEILKNFENAKNIQLEKSNLTQAAIIGKCPKCGANVESKPKGFFCTNKDCNFALWPTMKYFNNTLKITESRAETLLSGGHVAFTLKSKGGKDYKGYLKLKINGEYVNFEPDGFPPFPKKKK